MRDELVAEAPLVARPPLDEHRVIVEPVEKHFVVRIVQLIEEAVERFARGDHLFAFHAPARVEDDAEADRYAFVVEVRDRLKLIVLIDAKVFLVQTGDEPTVLIGDRRGDVNELDAGLETERLLIAGRGRLRLLMLLTLLAAALGVRVITRTAAAAVASARDLLRVMTGPLFLCERIRARACRHAAARGRLPFGTPRDISPPAPLPER